MREIGPISADAPAFPHAATGLAPLKAAAEKLGKVDFTNLWAGQAVRLGRDKPAAEMTRGMAGEAPARVRQPAARGRRPAGGGPKPPLPYSGTEKFPPRAFINSVCSRPA